MRSRCGQSNVATGPPQPIKYHLLASASLQNLEGAFRIDQLEVINPSHKKTPNHGLDLQHHTLHQSGIKENLRLNFAATTSSSHFEFRISYYSYFLSSSSHFLSSCLVVPVALIPKPPIPKSPMFHLLVFHQHHFKVFVVRLDHQHLVKAYLE